MTRALLPIVFALLASGCGPSFWTDVQYHDGQNQLLRPLPDFLVGRTRRWVLAHLGPPDETYGGPDATLVYEDRDIDLAELQLGAERAREEPLLSSYIEGTRYVRGMTLVLEEGRVRDVVYVSYRGGHDALAETLAQILQERDKAWIIAQLGPPDIVLPRMGGDTFVYRNRSLELWVLRVRPTLVNNPAIYTRREGNTDIRRMNVYFDRHGVVRDVSFPQGNPY